MLEGDSVLSLGKEVLLDTLFGFNELVTEPLVSLYLNIKSLLEKVEVYIDINGK